MLIKGTENIGWKLHDEQKPRGPAPLLVPIINQDLSYWEISFGSLRDGG